MKRVALLDFPNVIRLNESNYGNEISHLRGIMTVIARLGAVLS